MLVYFNFCIVVSSLLFSPSIDKPCTCKMSSDVPATISLQAICGGGGGGSNVTIVIFPIFNKFVVSKGCECGWLP